MTSALLQRVGLGNLLGFMFQGRRNLYDVFGYMQDGKITYKHALGKYRRQDIAARVIDAMADALWTNPPEISANDEAWNKAWKELLINKNLWSTIGRADRMAGMCHYATLVFGFDKSSALAAPLQAIDGRKVLYIQPYSADAADIKTLVNDETSERFMLPEVYTVKPSFQNEGPKKNSVFSRRTVTSFDVHASRVLHLAENPLTDEVFGNPRIERVFNLLDDILKVAGGSAETFWLIANRGLQVDVDKEMDMTPEDEADLNEEVEEYIHQLRRFIRTRGVKINNLGSDSPSPKDTFEMLISLLSGATGIPKRILLGSEAGQLASEQDRANWADRIDERRSNFGEPLVIWPLIRLLTNAGVLPSRDGLEITIKWPDAFKLSPLERGQTSAQRARSATNLAKTLTEQPDLMSVEEARDILELTKPETKADSESLTDKNTETAQ